MSKVKLTLQVPKMHVSVVEDGTTPLSVAIQHLKDEMFRKCPFLPTFEDVEDEDEGEDDNGS